MSLLFNTTQKFWENERELALNGTGDIESRVLYLTLSDGFVIGTTLRVPRCLARFHRHIDADCVLYAAGWVRKNDRYYPSVD